MQYPLMRYPARAHLPSVRTEVSNEAVQKQKIWEFEAGRPLPVGKKQRQQAIEEAAVVIQGEVRARVAHRSYKGIRDKELMTRGVKNIQGGKAKTFVDSLKTHQIRINQNAALGISVDTRF